MIVKHDAGDLFPSTRHEAVSRWIITVDRYQTHMRYFNQDCNGVKNMTDMASVDTNSAITIIGLCRINDIILFLL